MFFDTVLLHVIIVLSPTLLASLIYDRHAIGASPYVVGGLNGIAGALCVLYPYTSYGMDWDLRYIPLMIACIYAGPYSGAFAYVAINIALLLQGGETVVFELIGGAAIASVPMILSIVNNRRGEKMRRVRTLIAIAVWVGAANLSMLFLYKYAEDFTGPFSLVSSRNLWVTPLIFGIVYFIAIMLNEGVFERRQMKLEIARSEKLNALGEIAASIAHEIRNPLTVVKGFLQLMNQRNTGKGSEYLPLILSELARAETILNEYLSYAKPHLATNERVHVAAVIENIVVLLEPLSIIQGVQLESRLSVNPTVNGDRNQLQQALLNVTKNAIEATPSGGKVTLHLTNDGEWIYIKISDTGRGMSKEHLERLGTLFYSTKDKGTGLGTTVAWQIIRNMNGAIHYESKINVGTEATIKLPLAK